MAGTLTISTLSDGTNSTSSTNCIQGSAKAWVNWVGSTGAIRASYNVSSVTRNSTGYYTVNFTNAFADTNYAISSAGGEGGTTGMGQRVPSIGTVSTSSVNIACINQDATYTDGTYCCISVFR